jgi:hypothetical protein
MRRLSETVARDENESPGDETMKTDMAPTTRVIDITKALKTPDLRWPFQDELQWLAEQASQYKAIVEVGSYLGRSTIALAANTDGIVYALDDWYGPRDDASVKDEDRGNLFSMFMQNIVNAGCTNVQALRGDHSSPPDWLNFADMVFIDGSHEYEDVKRDINVWKARLKKGGLLCGHDRNEPGVRRALDELLPGWKSAPGNSLIWYVGQDRPFISHKPNPTRPLVTTCIPFSRNTVPAFSVSLASILPPLNGTYNLSWKMNQPRDLAREVMIEQAIEKEGKYVYCQDDDVTVPPNILRSLLFEFENASDDVMVVGGIYCTKTVQPMPLVYQHIGDGPFYKWKLGQVFPCDLIATGMMMIKLEVFKHLSKPWFKEVYTVSEARKYGLVSESYQGQNFSINDDGFFCHKVREAGFKILAHGGMLGMHWDEKGTAYILPDNSYPIRSEVERRWSEPPTSQEEYIKRVMAVYKTAYGYADLLPMEANEAAVALEG